MEASKEFDMVRTDEMWRYTRTVKLSHHHDGDVRGELTWETLMKVAESPTQGWEFTLECGCVLQSCFPETTNEVQTIWDDEILNWGKTPA
jgi:hypothetical protein